MVRTLSVQVDRFPLAQPFVISRGARTESVVVVAAMEQDGYRGRGECTPYARYNESVESVALQIESVRASLEVGASRRELTQLLPAGAARNALDCALFDLEAKMSGLRAWTLAGIEPPPSPVTAFTISIGSPQDMARDAALAANRPLLKIKLGGDGAAERIRAVRRAAPQSALIVDANEACAEAELEALFDVCAEAGVALLEQPLPAGRDAALARLNRRVPVCADESVHDRAGLAALRERYDAVNVKLDKTGGLTEALALVAEAQELGFTIMVGCMVATSLAMAPALLLTPRACFVDLDGPLLLAQDRPHGLVYDISRIRLPAPELWG